MKDPLYTAEAKQCYDEIEEALKPLRGDYGALPFMGALMLYLERCARINWGGTKRHALENIEKWARDWKEKTE